MPDGSYPFPIYSGILEPDHYKNIGNAIWLFLWCISSTTKEIEEEETVWGVVLGGKPMKLSEIAGYFGVNDKTVSRWMDALEQHQYINVTRAPRGLILKVRNSKKRSDRNVRSVESDQTKVSDHEVSDKTDMSDHNHGDQTILSDHTANLDSDRTKLSDLKDSTTTTTTTSESWDDILNPIPSGDDGMIEILDAYCKMHNKLDFNVSQKERLAMGKMVAGGTPSPFTIQTMASLLQAKRIREGESFTMPKSFLYYVEGIEQAWKIHQEKDQQPFKPVLVPNTQATAATQPRRLNRQQQRRESLQQRLREEEARGKS
ncbi:MarR family transcriptional regulator [Paenibacillus amylolyticus]|uniref:MarR family transcriptional regulator n=1 Tax=Paenibacillus amylolyticus TaxID=1451 RepID=UPI00201DDC66|nr:MarR family transcriptional regulator [Paenibacillus amylolyticus]MCL6661748.1 MarR family transcriptional regulator [Paenibacillus amylolyticus]